jgi:S1-C subfamily serine protease
MDQQPAFSTDQMPRDQHPHPPKRSSSIKRRLLPLVAACLITFGGLGGYALSLDLNQSTPVAAQTVSSTANTTTTSAIDQATEQAYATASKSVVYIVSQSVGSGSGIVYDSKGDIVTNDHVVSGASSISVTLSNGQTYQATVVGTDAADDLAVIHINASNLTPATFASAGSYQVAETVLAVGNPLDLKGSVTSGLISGLNRVAQEPNGAYLNDAIQTSAPINPGNSGGALVTLDGVVVGMPTLEQTSSSPGQTVQDVGFAIPSQQIVSLANQIVATGTVTHTGRAYLGITPTDASSQSGPGFLPGQTTPTTSGALVSQVASASPAANAGIQQGDVITKAGGATITDAQDLLNVLVNEKPGNHLTLILDRNGSTLTVTVTLSELPANG